ncbi:hypothetical protein OF83DRAFT_1172278 [Amylostereum chailletii]|nr:hypothetical protein OF83DRAFT_1172278 [Amylostereum chailletii]
MFENAFGHPECAQRSKEVDPSHDLRLLVEHMMYSKLHVLTKDRPIYAPQKTKKKAAASQSIHTTSAIVDILATGAEIWNSGKFHEFLRTTTYDPALGYPVEDEPEASRDQHLFHTDTAFDRTDTNPLEIDTFDDLDDGDSYSRVGGLGTLGGGIN